MNLSFKVLAPVISPPNVKPRSGSNNTSILGLAGVQGITPTKPKRKKQKLGAPKNLWSPREDRILGDEVVKLGEKAWSEIAAKLPGRVGKQCRDRWRNHLCPDVKKGSWTVEEDKLLFEYREKLGNQWAEIAKHIPGRTDLSVKNRYYSYRRKLQRQEKRQQKIKSSSPKETARNNSNSGAGKNIINNNNNRKSGKGCKRKLVMNEQPCVQTPSIVDTSGLVKMKQQQQQQIQQNEVPHTNSEESLLGSTNNKKNILPVNPGVNLPSSQTNMQQLLSASLLNNINLLTLFNLSNPNPTPTPNTCGMNSSQQRDAETLLGLTNSLGGMNPNVNVSGALNNKVNLMDLAAFGSLAQAQENSLGLMNRLNTQNLRVDTSVNMNPSMMSSPQKNPMNLTTPKTVYNRSNLCNLSAFAQLKQQNFCNN